MGIRHVSFRAGKDPFGNPVWIPASVEDREERDDGEWLCVLPAFAGYGSDPQWVRADAVRDDTPDADADPAPETAEPPRLRIVD